MESFIKDILQPFAIIFGIGFALYQYYKQQRFKRMQNLSSLWKQFSGDESMMALFSLMDELENGAIKTEELATFDSKTKLKYLAVIEEVALYVKEFEVDKDYAKYLFQWHFYFVYQSSKTTSSFWSNMGGNNEMNAHYWEVSRKLAQSFKPI